jgi:hypothetical protein
MRRARGLLAALALLLLLGTMAPPAGATPRVLSLLGWLNEQVKRSELAVLGQAQVDAYPDPHGGQMQVLLLVGQVYHGTRVPPRITVKVKPGWVGSRYVLPAAILRGQWVLLFCRYERGEWTAPPLGRIVETPHQGLTFVTDADVVLEDAAPGLSWSYVLDSLTQLVATRQQVINGYSPRLRLARTKEQRDRLQWAIEYEVKDHLGLPVP